MSLMTNWSVYTSLLLISYVVRLRRWLVCLIPIAPQ